MRLTRSSYSKYQSLGLIVCAIIALGFGSLSHAKVAVHEEASEAEVLEHADAAEGHGTDAHHEEIKGLPQLDFSTYASQIFWMFIAFGVLYVFFAKKTIPDVSGVIESRRAQIEGDLDNAERLKEDAEKAQAAYEAALADAREKASSLFRQAEENIKSSTAKRSEDFKAKSAKKIEATEKAVENAKNAALADTHIIAAEIASMAAQKIVGVSTDIDKAKSLVDTIGRKAA